MPIAVYLYFPMDKRHHFVKVMRAFNGPLRLVMVPITLPYYSACCAQLIFLHESEVDLSLSYVAVSVWLMSSVAYN